MPLGYSFSKDRTYRSLIRRAKEASRGEIRILIAAPPVNSTLNFTPFDHSEDPLRGLLAQLLQSPTKVITCPVEFQTAQILTELFTTLPVAVLFYTANPDFSRAKRRRSIVHLALLDHFTDLSAIAADLQQAADIGFAKDVLNAALSNLPTNDKGKPSSALTPTIVRTFMTLFDDWYNFSAMSADQFAVSSMLRGSISEASSIAQSRGHPPDHQSLITASAATFVPAFAQWYERRFTHAGRPALDVQHEWLKDVIRWYYESTVAQVDPNVRNRNLFKGA